MIAEKLVELVDIHAAGLWPTWRGISSTNERDARISQVPSTDLEERVFRLFHHLGDGSAIGVGER